MYKCDTLLLTSIREGSPQVIKEAMACGCPIVSVDVGDVAERLTGLDGCYIATSRTPEELAKLLEKSICFGRTKGREQLLNAGFDNAQIAEKLISIYTKVIKK
jgi:glycosyltransferase involved in cell wall biosynthesis